MLDFTKHTVVVTGAGGGLGRVYVFGSCFSTIILELRTMRF